MSRQAIASMVRMDTIEIPEASNAMTVMLSSWLIDADDAGDADADIDADDDFSTRGNWRDLAPRPRHRTKITNLPASNHEPETRRKSKMQGKRDIRSQ